MAVRFKNFYVAEGDIKAVMDSLEDRYRLIRYVEDGRHINVMLRNKEVTITQSNMTMGVYKRINAHEIGALIMLTDPKTALEYIKSVLL